MAKIKLPQEFIDKFNNKQLTWFIKEGELEYDTIIVTESIVLENIVNDTDIAIGMRYENNTYGYQPLKDIVYNTDDTFSITVGDRTLKHVKLIALHNITDNITRTVDVNDLTKIVHLAKGMQGSKGDTGKSAYDIVKECPEGSKYTEDEFREGLIRAIEVEKVVKDLKHTVDTQSLLLQRAFDFIRTMDEIPIGAIMYSHNCPNKDLWLPWGGDVITYADRDYPELAKIVRSWNNPALIVDDEHFRLSDDNNKNRYIFSASSAKPSGRFMESQLPNITGRFGGDSYEIGYDNGVFWATGGGKGNDGSGAGGLHYMDASRASEIYKNDITQVYGDSIGMCSWIKAKRLEITI